MLLAAAAFGTTAGATIAIVTAAGAAVAVIEAVSKLGCSQASHCAIQYV